MKVSVISVALFAATVAAHGLIINPPSRKLGPSMTRLCGQTAFDIAKGDVTASLETVAPNITAGCPLTLCRGHQFDDNLDKLSVFRPGQIVPMKIELSILHGGPANVSIVKTATNTLIGPPLIIFDDYGNRDLPALPPNNTDFAVTMPTNLADTDCRVAGDCALQWFWSTIDNQTYVGCSDFILFGH
ncbi:hypothetical protein LA080_011034 [Diaporthe eres]|uniref:Chitin-binding type-4 domain-containing protein n=1 Tax=Diaporthe vaccinii TaxID=105482 RepID=A0ABR4EDL9_9PEZI|nr:hypothetical protein LA080_011034 [Diaporthe eres]